MISMNTYQVDCKKMIDNINSFRKWSKRTKICAIVKADAYGHGLKTVVSAINNFVDFFGVADFMEAMQVREASNVPVLILGPVDVENIADCISNNISLSVSTFEYLLEIEKQSKKIGQKAKIHIAVNTGMNRLGFSSIEKFKKVLYFIKKSSFLTLEGVYTHFFEGTSKDKTEKQYKIFCEYCKEIKDNSVIKHAAASNAALLGKKYHFDMVRLGLIVYGYADIKNNLKLKPALLVKSKIVNIIHIKKGENVGYLSGFKAKRDMTIACIGFGYSDGLARLNSNNGKVIIMNKYAKIVGIICMNLFMVDISNISCNIGDEVIIVGKSKTKRISPRDIAKRTKTACCEVLTNFRRDRMNYKVDWK